MKVEHRYTGMSLHDKN